MEILDVKELTTNISYPTLSDRIQSTFIDTLFIVLLMFVSASVLERFEQAPDWIRIALFFGLWAVYEPVATSLGGTLGNYIKGIRVRRVSDPEKRINIARALVRYLFKITLGWLSFISIHFNTQRRAIHDLVAGSIMTKKS